MKMLLDGILANLDVHYLHFITLFLRPEVKFTHPMGGYTNLYLKYRLVEFGGPEGSVIYRVRFQSDGTIIMHMGVWGIGCINESTPSHVTHEFKKYIDKQVEEILL